LQVEISNLNDIDESGPSGEAVEDLDGKQSNKIINEYNLCLIVDCASF
jgi:hypothetical protein